MSPLIQVVDWLTDTGMKLFSMVVNDWYIIGSGMVAIFIMSRAVRFIKRMFM